MFDSQLGMIHEVVNGVDGSGDVVLIWVKWMPVVHVIEFQVNAIVIVISLSEQQVRFIDYLEIVVCQMVDIILNHNLYQFT